MRGIPASVAMAILLLLLPDGARLRVRPDSTANSRIDKDQRSDRPHPLAAGIRRSQSSTGVWQIELLSAAHTVDRVYRSMRGPQERRSLPLFEFDRPERVWITGCRLQMVAEDGVTPSSNRFTCHTNIDRGTDHASQAGQFRHRDQRLFTLSQGQTQIRFPAGFGIPLASDTQLDVVMQVLNLEPLPVPVRVRHRLTMTVVRERAGATPMIPLYETGISGMKTLKTSAPGPAPLGHALWPDKQRLKTSQLPIDTSALCLSGRMASVIDQETDRWGRRVTGHWLLAPGRETLSTRVTHMLDLDCDTTVHCIAVHLHPFAESLELFDATLGRRVFISHARPSRSRLGLRSVDTFSSVDGIPIYRDHEYVLKSVYNNTTGEDQDAMAVLYLYLRDCASPAVPSDGLFPELPWNADGLPSGTSRGAQ